MVGHGKAKVQSSEIEVVMYANKMAHSLVEK
jgi:hypothetical protein